jgi:hypothetical protein
MSDTTKTIVSSPLIADMQKTVKKYMRKNQCYGGIRGLRHGAGPGGGALASPSPLSFLLMLGVGNPHIVPCLAQ